MKRVFTLFILILTLSILIPIKVSAIEKTKTVDVLILKYFPLDDSREKLDFSETGLNISLLKIRRNVDIGTQRGLNYLKEASKYHGYKNPLATSYLNYVIADTKEYLKQMPLSKNHAWNKQDVYRPNYYKMLTEDVNICNYVDNKNVRQVWIWGYHYDDIEPDESNMAMGIVSSRFYNHGSYGDVSNGQEIDDLPVCSKTYVLYNYSYGYDDRVSYLLEDHTHHIEKVLSFVDSTLWKKFVNPYGSKTAVNHCGWTHSPPNTTKQYDWQNETTVSSDCENWTPDGTGKAEQVNCRTWHHGPCLNDEGTAFKLWWMQNIPGYNNNLYFQGKLLRNWWDFIGDFDKSLAESKSLTYFTISHSDATFHHILTPFQSTLSSPPIITRKIASLTQTPSLSPNIPLALKKNNGLILEKYKSTIAIMLFFTGLSIAILSLYAFLPKSLQQDIYERLKPYLDKLKKLNQ